jgi:adenosine/AMP kinase
MVTLEVVKIKKPEDVNVILGQSHFIKTVEDLYEVLIGACPSIKFGFSFCESSGACLVRSEGNDTQLKKLSQENALMIAAGHSFIILLKDAYPINVLNAVKQLPEVCCIYCASANPIEIIIGATSQGRGILGVVDGLSAKGVEGQQDILWRKDLLRKIGYKL